MYQSINIFPTTLYVGDLDNHKEYKDKFYKVYSKFDYEDDNWHNTTSENSGNPLIHLEESLEPLFIDIVSHVENYIYEVLKYKKIFDIIITKTWLSRAKSASDSLKWHNHSTSHISFSYYLNTPKNSHAIKFLNPSNTNSLFAGLNTSDYKHGIQEFNEVNSSTFFLHPKEGNIILFPSSIRHCTDSQGDSFEGERLAIVGDITLIYKPEILDYSQGYINSKYWKMFK